MENNYDAIVIGSGLGGLFSGAILAKKGYRPLIIEKLSFFGGKFTSFNYYGYEIPTGAFHALPGGQYGNVGRLIRYLNLRVEIIEATPAFIVSTKNNNYFMPFTLKDFKYLLSKNSIIRILSIKEMLQLLRIIYIVLYSNSNIPDVSIKDFAKKYTNSNKTLNLLNKIISFTISTDIEDASANDFVISLRKQNKNFEGVIKGGCKALITELVRYIEKNGGTFLNNTEVNEIIVKDQKAIGVVTDKNTFFGDLIISNAGPKNTAIILRNNCPKWLIEKINKSIPAFGITYSIISDKPLLDHKSVYIPLDAEKITGCLQISNFDKNLSRKNKHFLLAYQLVNINENIDDAIKLGKNDLFKVFPKLSEGNILNISTYKNEWPTTFTQQRLGQAGCQRYPIQVKGIKNLYMISHDSEGYGLAAEIIGDAALKLNEMIEANNY
ncbi:MAG: hypothetical protein C3F06_03105 [Candidatus Methanoperedenaceae archaeon]|nr:MAG: hypothetical protein C3F06_03105 [Candidatus Methanoperedenaceae archaeon]